MTISCQSLITISDRYITFSRDHNFTTK